MRQIFDAIMDIAIVGVLVFTVLMTVDSIIWKFILTLAGCGAMFNNVKYLYNAKKKRKSKKKSK